MLQASYQVEAFSSQDLDVLEASLDPQLLEWSNENPFVRTSSKENSLIRDLAAIHGLSKVMLARGRLIDFELAVTIGLDMSTLSSELQGYAPKERAGTAAAHLAVAKLISGWYGLEQSDYARLPLPQDVFAFVQMSTEGLQEAVCSKPQELGITSFNARDVFLETMFKVQDSVVADGPEALTPYLEFPEYPHPIRKF